MTLIVNAAIPSRPVEPASQPAVPRQPQTLMLIDLLLRRQWPIIWGAALGLIAATLVLLLVPQQWRTATDIELTPSRHVNDGARQDVSASLTDAAVENQGVMALSQPVLQRAAKMLTQNDLTTSDNTMAQLRANVSVRRLPRTMVWRITGQGATPVSATLVANSVARAWADQHATLQIDAATRLAQRIRERLPALEQQLRQSENAAAAWRRRHALISDGSPSGASLTERGLTTLNERLAEARADAISARTNLKKFSTAAAGDGHEDASPEMQALRQQLTDLGRRDAELATRYGPQYPERTAVRAQIGATGRAISARKQQKLGDLRTEADAAAARELALRQTLDSTSPEDTGSQGAASDNAIRLRELERQASADRQAYEMALARLRNSEEQVHLGEPEARILSPATIDQARGPAPAAMVLILAGFGGALACVCLATLRERIKDPCLSAQQVADDLNVARVAEAPLLGRDLRKARGHIMQPATVVAMRPLSRFAEGFRTIRTSLDAAIAQRPATRPQALISRAPLDCAGTDEMPIEITAGNTPRGNIVLVTSSQPGDGKTTTAIGLALSLADAGHRVALVDADLRRAGLTQFFDLRAQNGLAEMLRDHAPLTSASVRKAKIVIIPAGSLAGAGARPLSLVDAPTGELLLRLAETFDHLIVDGPPIDVTEDAEVLLRAADTAVLALRWGHTPRCRARAIAERLARQDKLGAVMLTRIDLKRTPRYGPQASYSDAALRGYFRG